MRRLLDRITRPLVIPREEEERAKALVAAEWLVTNGLGGYSSGTVAGVNTRRHHGLLVAALPNPIGRLAMLNHLGERICIAGGEPTALNGEERTAGRVDPEVARRFVGFRLEAGLPIWEYELQGSRVEKRLYMPHKQNTVFVRYCLTKGEAPANLELHPA
jgi:predicted glycogen debranching enzyme